MPVVERGFGMDRTLYKLPVLILDDYSDLTPEILRQAYVEALYRADDWEYERMTHQYWEHLLFSVSQTLDVNIMLDKHPMTAEDANFTRPLIPFDCAAMGGCGAGTKRTPKQSCAIDTSVMNSRYRWDWDHSINDKKN